MKLISNLTIPELVQIVFIILKLFKVIHWNWIWVLSPAWITISFIIIAVIIQKIKDKRDGY